MSRHNNNNQLDHFISYFLASNSCAPLDQNHSVQPPQSSLHIPLDPRNWLGPLFDEVQTSATASHKIDTAELFKEYGMSEAKSTSTSPGNGIIEPIDVSPTWNTDPFFVKALPSAREVLIPLMFEEQQGCIPHHNQLQQQQQQQPIMTPQFTIKRLRGISSTTLPKKKYKKRSRGLVIAEDNVAPRYPCTFGGCKKTFSTAGHASRHERVHGGMEQRRFVCSWCGMRFYRGDNLRVHESVHA